MSTSLQIDSMLNEHDLKVSLSRNQPFIKYNTNDNTNIFPISMQANATERSHRKSLYPVKYTQSDIQVPKYCQLSDYNSTPTIVIDDTDTMDLQESTSPIPSRHPSTPLNTLRSTTNSFIFNQAQLLSQDVDDYQWRAEFLDLMSKILEHSENLEDVSIELLGIESKVRELILLEKSLTEQYEQQEKMYMESLDVCEQVFNQQLNLTQSLIDLDQSIINNNIISSNSSVSSTTTALNYHHHHHHHHHYHYIKRNQVVHVNSTEKIHSLRLELGLLIGGSVGTGHVVHSYEIPHQGPEYIIAGSGTCSTNYKQQQEFNRYQYLLHINQHDRETKFTLLPKELWTPDYQTNQCQFKSCVTQFTLFNRRHHCRRCGILVCQKHSLNQLPLFSKKESKWHRICDSCFYDLIIKDRDSTPSFTTL